MNEIKPIKRVSKSQPTVEGAGVHLKRAFGFRDVPRLDPFLLLDDFHSDNPADYLAGFPWHPHRGIETITYVLEGEVEHGDSLGNQGVIGPGDVQWMTAGSGIIHQEMPQEGTGGRMGGFQLWANLPAAHKMMPPRYQEVKSCQIPQVNLPGGGVVRVICGEVDGVQGPVQDIVTEPRYLDVSLPAGAHWQLATPAGHTVFAYIFEGQVRFGVEGSAFAANRDLVLLGDGDQLAMTAGKQGGRFLLVSGKPIGEPVHWRGPIVMSSEQELRKAFEELRDGTFIKS
jgi:redox-sensitive bicupin YhaK (pirin superfamily)